MENIVAYRIKNARILKGLTLQAVADYVGVSKQMISKYENGNSMPDSKKFILLSRLFNQKIDYFFSSFKVELGEVNFRKKASFSEKKQNSLRENIKIKLENYIWLEDLLNINYNFKNNIESNTINSITDIEKAVLQLKNHWNIGTDPVHNIIQLLEDKEIKVLELFEVDDKFDGLATYVNGIYPVIVVNGNFGVERKRFTLLHELGHLLLNIQHLDIKTQEAFCNYFASEFLLPKNHLIQEFGTKRLHFNLIELIAIQKKYGISIPAIVYKLSDIDVISKDKLKQFYQKLNFNPSLKSQVNQFRFETPERSDRFQSLVYRALSEEIISISKASALLNKDIATIKANVEFIY